MNTRHPQNHNNLNNWLNSYFNAALAGVLLVFLLLAYFLFLGPKFDATKAAIEANIADQENLYVLSQRKLANLKAVAAVYDSIRAADLAKFNGVLPDAYVPERLFGELEEMAASGGWLIKEVTVTPVGVSAADRRLGQISVELSMSGLDYIGFKRFLRLLENNLRLMDVSSLEFSPSDNSANITLTTYYYQPAS